MTREDVGGYLVTGAFVALVIGALVLPHDGIGYAYGLACVLVFGLGSWLAN